MIRSKKQGEEGAAITRLCRELAKLGLGLFVTINHCPQINFQPVLPTSFMTSSCMISLVYLWGLDT